MRLVMFQRAVHDGIYTLPNGTTNGVQEGAFNFLQFYFLYTDNF